MILEDLDMELRGAILDDENCEIIQYPENTEECGSLIEALTGQTIIFSEGWDVVMDGCSDVFLLLRKETEKGIWTYTAVHIGGMANEEFYPLFLQRAEIAVFNERTGTCKFTENWKGGGVDEKKQTVKH